jgi:hypothetical protein
MLGLLKSYVSMTKVTRASGSPWTRKIIGFLAVSLEVYTYNAILYWKEQDQKLLERSLCPTKREIGLVTSRPLRYQLGTSLCVGYSLDLGQRAIRPNLCSAALYVGRYTLRAIR